VDRFDPADDKTSDIRRLAGYALKIPAEVKNPAIMKLSNALRI
jgi:hypothetical protein